MKSLSASNREEVDAARLPLFRALLQGKLGLDRGVRLENLMVSHFLSVMDRLADLALLQFVKHLQSRAQGEVSRGSIFSSIFQLLYMNTSDANDGRLLDDDKALLRGVASIRYRQFCSQV